MATAKPTYGQLPSGFVSPFTRVEMMGTHDDLLACAATLCGKSIDDAKKVAVALGMSANGPFHVDEDLFRKILFNLGQLTAGEYQELTDIAALPDVTVLSGRHLRSLPLRQEQPAGNPGGLFLFRTLSEASAAARR